MIVPGSANPLLLGQSSGYNLTRSLRFRSSASAYLNRTPASAGNRQKFTISFWVKRGTLGTAQRLINCVPGSTDSTYFSILFQSNDQLSVGLQNGGLTTTQVFRDPSAWYHIVIAVDATQATAANREIIYINGVQCSSYSSSYYIAQNTDLAYNSANQHLIGQQTNTNYFDGYIAEFNSIDGQTLTPSSFGETSSTTGVWQPKRYTGTYGTNGFYLPFTDNSALTSGSNAGLGKDFSGNGNYWNTNNISITSGATYDSMTDVPTLTSATASNFCVLNPLSKIYSSATISDGNLNFTTSTVNMGAFGTFQLPTSGKYYWEIVMTANAGGSPLLGFGPATDSLGNAGVYYRTDGTKNQFGGVSGNGTSAYGATWTTNDVIGIAYDADTSSGQVTFYKNNSTQGVAYSSLLTNFPNGLFASFQSNANGTTTFQANFGQRPFAYTPPTGYVALNTYNLPTPTIGATASSQANKYFDATTYTGNGSSQTVTNAGGFKPDFVWVKDRTNAYNHILASVPCDITHFLQSNTTDAESVSTGRIDAVTSTGFTVGSAANTNQNGDAYVGWQWRASNAAGVTNTAGSITSTVSANTTSGFSIVTYTGTGANATVGHGLGVAPKMMIFKNRSSSSTWIVYHSSISPTNLLTLNQTAAQQNLPAYFNSTAPSSTVFSIGSNSDMNASGASQVAYCFAEIAGFSKFGSYTGNGSTDGPFIYTGFRPRYIVTKLVSGGSTSGVGNWRVRDTARDPYNVSQNILYPNLSDAEVVDNQVDILSNGFKLRNALAQENPSGGTVIYMAFAENPFKYSLAR